MHSGNRSAHDVCVSRICIVCWAPIPARCARVGVIHVSTMRMAVVLILPRLVKSGRTRGLLRAGTIAAKPGGLLWEITTYIVTAGTAVTVAAAVASVAAIVECGLLLWRGIDVGRGLLADTHAELLDVRQLALHSGHGGCPGLHRFLRGSASGSKVHE